MKTTRKIIAGTTIATGLLFSAVAPAQADRGGYGQTPERCEKIERVTTKVVDRITRMEDRINELEGRVAESDRPNQVARLERKIARLEARITDHLARYDEFELYCDGLDGDVADLDIWDDLNGDDEDATEEPPADECSTARVAADGDDAVDDGTGTGSGDGTCDAPTTDEA